MRRVEEVWGKAAEWEKQGCFLVTTYEMHKISSIYINKKYY